MSDRLPVQIDPIRLADEGVRLRGELSGGEMMRLQESGNRIGKVAVDVQFERNAQGERLLNGTIQTSVETVCQRCLQPLVFPIVAQPMLVLLPSGEAEVTHDYDALRIGALIMLSEWAEDELLLVMPISPMHGDTECAFMGKAGSGPVTRRPVSEKKEHPFAELHGFVKAKPAHK